MVVRFMQCKVVFLEPLGLDVHVGKSQKITVNERKL